MRVIWSLLDNQAVRVRTIQQAGFNFFIGATFISNTAYSTGFSPKPSHQRYYDNLEIIIVIKVQYNRF